MSQEWPSQLNVPALALGLVLALGCKGERVGPPLDIFASSGGSIVYGSSEGTVSETASIPTSGGTTSRSTSEQSGGSTAPLVDSIVAGSTTGQNSTERDGAGGVQASLDTSTSNAGVAASTGTTMTTVVNITLSQVANTSGGASSSTSDFPTGGIRSSGGFTGFGGTVATGGAATTSGGASSSTTGGVTNSGGFTGFGGTTGLPDSTSAGGAYDAGASTGGAQHPPSSCEYSKAVCAALWMRILNQNLLDSDASSNSLDDAGAPDSGT